MAPQQCPHKGSRRPAPRIVWHMGQSAGKTRSSAARLKLESTDAGYAPTGRSAFQRWH